MPLSLSLYIYIYTHTRMRFAEVAEHVSTIIDPQFSNHSAWGQHIYIYIYIYIFVHVCV